MAWACSIAALASAPRALSAQSGTSKEGALFLLVPVGARAVGMGQAVSALELGSEAIWWNPAALARLTKSEVAISHSSTIVATGDALVVVVPAGRAGVVAAAAYLFNPGQQDITDPNQATVGTISPRSVVLAASYAATFGPRVSAGVTYKLVQDRLDCTGSCSVPTFQSTTSAFDVGVQAIGDKDRRLTLALAVRNVGFRLQVNDAEQADPLPSRLQAGAQYLVPSVERLVANGTLRIGVDVVDRLLAIGNPSLRVGGEFAYKQEVFVRAGLLDGSGDGSHTALGLGFQRGGFSLDFARAFGGTLSDAGTSPTYVTLRFRF